MLRKRCCAEGKPLVDVKIILVGLPGWRDFMHLLMYKCSIFTSFFTPPPPMFSSYFSAQGVHRGPFYLLHNNAHAGGVRNRMSPGWHLVASCVKKKGEGNAKLPFKRFLAHKEPPCAEIHFEDASCGAANCFFFFF